MVGLKESLVDRYISSLSLYFTKESKNISSKMLKDVGMTVPKSRETSAVYCYMQQHRGMRAVYLYAARQG